MKTLKAAARSENLLIKPLRAELSMTCSKSISGERLFYFPIVRQMAEITCNRKGAQIPCFLNGLAPERMFPLLTQGMGSGAQAAWEGMRKQVN